MTVDFGIEMFRRVLQVTAMVGGPIVLVALIAGLILGVLQAATQVNDQVLPFAVKASLVGVLLFLGSHWMLDAMVDFVKLQFSDFSAVLHSQ